jgi:omega-amidase
MNEILRIAVLQYDVNWHNLDANLKKIEFLLEKISGPVDLIILPEMFATGFTMQPELFSSSIPVGVIGWMKKISAAKNATVLGSNPWKAEIGFLNRMMVVKSNGSTDYYDKRHLFSIGDEDKHYIAGKERKIIDVAGWKIFPTICYDLRFPVWCRNNLSYDLLINITNWPAIREEAWETLLRARAIENQAYIIGSNRIGTDGRKIDYNGKSIAISMKGDVIAAGGNSEEIIRIDLNKYELQEFRKAFPVLKDLDSFQLL